MAKKDYRLIEKTTRKLPHALTPEERERLKDAENNLGEKVLNLEREHERIRGQEKDEARARREAIKDARSAWVEAMDARRTGVAPRETRVEVRAVIATQTIDVVIAKSGEILESRPMTEEERRDYLQAPLDLTPATEGQEAPPAEEVAAKADAVPESEPAAQSDEPAAESDELDEGEAEALGLPVGWPRSWRGNQWTVRGEALREADVLDVYLRLKVDGTTIDEVLDGAGAVQGMAALGCTRASVGRALSLLRAKGLARRLEAPGVWGAVDKRRPHAEPEVEPEPGRTDTLPEAADAPRPRRQGRRPTKADALVNAAAEQSDGWGLPTGGAA